MGTLQSPEFGPEDGLLRDCVRDRLARAVTPELIISWDESGTWPEALWDEMAALGWVGSGFPEEAGGGGGGLAALGVVAQELGRAAAPLPFLPTVAAGLVTSRVGGGHLARTITSGLCAGDPATLMWPVDPAATLTARADGERLVISGGGVLAEWGSEARHIVCVAPLPDDAGRVAVAALTPGIAGLEVQPVRVADNERGAWVRCHEVVAGPAEYLVAGGTVAAADLAPVLGAVRLVRAAELIGGIEGMLVMSVEHVATRIQFGQPIGKFQAVQHALADVAIALEAARLATWEGLSADRDDRLEAAGALAAWLAGRAALLTAATAAQVHGGVGAMQVHGLPIRFRRAAAMTSRLGAGPAQLRQVAAAFVDPATSPAPGTWLVR